MSVALDTLRRTIREIEGRPPALRAVVSCGWASLDASGGLPRPGVVRVVGAPGSGALRIALTLMASCTARGERAVWVEPSPADAPDGWPLYPPTAIAWGADPARWLLVRASGAQGAWAVEQAIASGACGLVVASGIAPAGAGARWVRAAWRGHTSLVVLGDRLPADLPGDVTVEIQGEGAVRLVRRARGRGAVVSLPAWPEGIDPWR